jgi:DnaJ-class molecular chaperone
MAATTISFKKNYYDILGVVHTVSQPDLVRAFRKLLITKHPDKNPNNLQAYQEFLLITEAYETLGDPSKRRRYDMGGIGDALPPHTEQDWPHSSSHVSSLFFTRFSMAHGTPLDQAFDNPSEIYDTDFQGEDIFLKRKQASSQ